MNLSLFKKLPFEKQLDYLVENGIDTGLFIYRRNAKVILYLLSEFYVEISVATNGNDIIALKPFNSVKKLDVFLLSISLNEVHALIAGE